MRHLIALEPQESTPETYPLFKVRDRVTVNCPSDSRHGLTGTVVRHDDHADFYWVRFEDDTEGNYHASELART